MRSFDSFINDNAWQSLPYLAPAGLCRVICDLNSFSYLSLASSNNTLLLLLLLLLVLLLPESSCCTSVVVSAGTSLLSFMIFMLGKRQRAARSLVVSQSSARLLFPLLRLLPLIQLLLLLPHEIITYVCTQYLLV